MGISLVNYPGAFYVRIGGLNYPYEFFKRIGLNLAEGERLKLAIYRSNGMVFIEEDKVAACNIQLEVQDSPVEFKIEEAAPEVQGEAEDTDPVLHTRTTRKRPR